MAQKPTRHLEVRLLLIAVVEITHSALVERLAAQPHQLSSIPDVVAEEVMSNLESVPYVADVIVARL